jgi:hypothetical protein
VVIIDPKTIRFKETPAEVNVLTRGELLRWLKKREPVLAPRQIANCSRVNLLASRGMDLGDRDDAIKQLHHINRWR